MTCRIIATSQNKLQLLYFVHNQFDITIFHSVKHPKIALLGGWRFGFGKCSCVLCIKVGRAISFQACTHNIFVKIVICTVVQATSKCKNVGTLFDTLHRRATHNIRYNKYGVWP